MSKRINHTRANLRQRIARENRYASRSEKEWDSRYDKPLFKWRAVYFKKHMAKTLAELLFLDPNYVVFLYLKDILFRRLLGKPTTYQMDVAHQLEVLANCAQHMLPPLYKRGTHEFLVIADRNDVFERVVLVKKNHFPRFLKKGSKIADRRAELDIGLPLYFNNAQLGFSRMKKCLRRIYFKDMVSEPITSDYERYWTDASNFNLSGCSSHKSLLCTPRDQEILTRKLRSQKYSGSEL